MTAAVRDLATAFPGRYAIHVGGSCEELWANNPHVIAVCGARVPRNMPIVRVSYRSQLAEANDRPLHFLTAFHRALSENLKVSIPVLLPHGDLHLTDDEKQTRPFPNRYWYFVAGGKSDMRTKIWPAAYARQLVTLLASEGIKLVQGGASLPGHEHPDLPGVLTTVGKTSLRDVLRLVYHADGVICPVTFAMHVAAAFQKPCVVTAGGREPWWWEAYINSDLRHFGNQCSAVAVPHRFLHSIGTLVCCEQTGCWKTDIRIPARPDSTDCGVPVAFPDGGLYASCQNAAMPENVRDAVLDYCRDGLMQPMP
jgi:hypothetical protein